MKGEVLLEKMKGPAIFPGDFSCGQAGVETLEGSEKL